MVLLNQRHHGSDAVKNATTSGSYQHGLRSEASGYNIELGSRTGGRASTMDIQSPRPPRPPLPAKAQGLVGGGEYQSSVPLSEVKFNDARLGYKGSSDF